MFQFMFISVSFQSVYSALRWSPSRLGQDRCAKKAAQTAASFLMRRSNREGAIVPRPRTRSENAPTPSA
ncbi:MAG: hypothetical protein V4793_40910, partial [Paraburkholderia tropica]